MPWPQRYAGCSRRADSGVAYSGILIFNQRVASSWDGYAARTAPRSSYRAGTGPTSLAYAYGLRVGEIVLLDQDDVDVERERIRRLKGGLSRERPIFRNLIPLLRHYLGNRRDDEVRVILKAATVHLPRHARGGSSSS